MKWIKRIGILALSILAGVVFAVNSQQVEADGGAGWTIDPSGNLYLLSESGTLRKVSPEGRLVWEVDLPGESEEGDLLRYGELISDSSGALYLAVQEMERRVDAAGAVQEIILAETVQAFNGDGVRQEDVLRVDKTTLSQYSTTPYIQKLQMRGEILVALCLDQGRFDVIEAQPYGAAAPAVTASYTLEETAETLEDFAALSDGTLVYSTSEGGLYTLSPTGEERSLRQLVGSQSLAGQLSAEETDLVCCVDRRSGVLYQIDLADFTVERLYSPDTVIDSANGLTFGQLRGAWTVGGGDFLGISADGGCYVRFGTEITVISSIHRGWDRGEVLKTALVILAALLLLSLLTWALGLLSRRSLLTGRILLQALPAAVLVMAVLVGGSLWIYVGQEEENQRGGLAAAAKAAAARLEGVLSAGGELADQGDQAAAYAADVSGAADVGLLLYTLDQGDYYGVYTSQERDAFATADYLAPLAMELPEETVEAILAVAEEGGSVSFTRNGVDYISCFQPLTDGDRAVGLVEARAVRQSALAFLERGPAFYACAAGLAGAIILLLWLLAVLGSAFRPLKELSRCIAEISAGNWSVQAKITSRDELADIAANFNQMTEKLNQYISNMVVLNNEYIKFTPRELFQLLGKTKVTDLKLRDKSVRDMSLLYVTFRLDGEKLDSEGYFNLMNENFNKIFDVVDMNRGIIERFDGAGMLALFPWQVRDALNTAISLKEIMARENQGVELKMLISADETLVGVAGNQKRQTITAISDTIMDIYALGSLMDELGTCCVITKRAVTLLSDSFYFNCREIGAGDSGRESLYEFLDGMEPYEKKLHLVTREEFEQGIHAYQRGDCFAARKHFASVLQVNERDAVAMYYLMLCDTRAQTEAALSQ